MSLCVSNYQILKSSMSKKLIIGMVLLTVCFGQAFRFKLIGSCLLQPAHWCDCYDIIVLDTLAFLVDEDLTVINIARPDSPFILTQIDTTHEFTCAIAPEFPYIYAIGDGGFASFDINDLQLPSFLDSIGIPLFRGDMALNNGYAYCTNDNGFHVLDVSIPDTLMYLGIIDSIHIRGRLRIGNDFLFETIGFRNLFVFDVSNPANPGIIDSLILPISGVVTACKPWLGDSLLYVPYLSYYEHCIGLWIINVADPMNPFLVAESPDVGERVNGSYDLTLSGKYAYATIGSQMERSSRKPEEQYEQPENVAVFDVSDPTSPFPVWLYEVPVANYRAIDSRADTIYLCDGEYFYIFVDTLWTGLSETCQVGRISNTLQCWPNPCNDLLTIKHSLGQYKDYARSIAIYDISGRLVYSAPISKKEESGVVIWDCKSLTGKRVPAGVYLVALRCKESNLVVEKIIITN